MASRVIPSLRKTTTFLSANLRPTRAPLAYVGGWLGKENLGDEALLAAAKALFPTRSLWHFDGSRTLDALLNRIPRTDNGVFAGGTLINRCPEYLQIAEKFCAGGRNLHIFGTGVALPEFWRGRSDFTDTLPGWKRLLERGSYVGVRGPLSAQVLSDLGLKHVEIVGDPAIAFAYDALVTDWVSGSLGLNIGHDHGNQWGNQEELIGFVGSLATMARKAGWTIKWFVVYPGDLDITQTVARETRTAEHIICSYRDPRHYLSQVRSVSTFIGMKLHATMLAMCAQVPSLMLEYDPKCADFMASIHASSVMRTDRLDGSKAWDLMQTWNENRQFFSSNLFNAITSLKRVQKDKAEALSLLFR